MDTQVVTHEEAHVVARLRDGGEIRLRPIGPQDRQRLAEGWTRLSPESRYRRFFVDRPRLSERILRYLTEVDQQEHVAWGAIDPTDRALPGVGVGRFICLPGGPARAEAALTVLDAYQGRGLGTLLLAVLYRQARMRGVRVLRSVLLPDRSFLAEWMKRLGAALRDRRDYYEVDLPVHTDPGRLPRNPSARRFRELLAELDALRFVSPLP